MRAVGGHTARPSRPLTPTRRRVYSIFSWLVTAAWAGLIFEASTEHFGSSFTALLLSEALRFLHLTVSAGTFDTLHFVIRKLAHLTEYAIFSMLLYGSIGGPEQVRWRAQTAFWSILVAGFYSLTDEFHQSFVPGRTASLVDCGIDTAGAALAMLGLYASGRLFPQITGKHPTLGTPMRPE